MERRVAVIGGIGVAEILGIVFDYSFEESKIGKVYGTADACWGIDPEMDVRVCSLEGGDRSMKSYIMGDGRDNWEAECLA